MRELLGKIPIFSELTEEELERLARITSRRYVARRAFVFMEGEKRDAVYFIQEGIIKAYKIDGEGNEQVISILHPGEMFPHVGFFDTSPYPATTEALQDTSLLAVHIGDFERLLLENPKISLEVMRMLGQKILHLQQRLQEFISGDVHRRVARALLHLAEESGEPRAEGTFIGFPITNQDFANMVGTSRESVNRTLSQLKKEGVLQLDRHGILILDMHFLKEM